MNVEKQQSDVASSFDARVRAFQTNPNNIGAAAKLVEYLHDLGLHEKATEIRAHMIFLLVNAARQDLSANLVCDYLHKLYASTVKKIESEEHVRACYQAWVEPVAELGRKYQDPILPKKLWKAYSAKPWRPAFFFHNAAILGHTEALLELLAHRPDSKEWSDPIVYTLEGYSPEFNNEFESVGASVINLATLVPDAGYLQRFRMLRELIAQDKVSHLVWVSAPLYAEFAMAMRLAPAQVLWTLKFHPFQIPEIDGYITYGAWSEDVRVVHGEKWQVVPFMMAKEFESVSEEMVSKAREPFSRYEVLFGALARTEKIDSEPYLKCVVRILKENPHSAYLWTGRAKHYGIQRQFEEAGVADRCHFIGWVSTPVYARVLDVFLETFPFGCGLTGIQALAAGTPLVSYAAPETQYGMHFMRPLIEGGAAAKVIRDLLEPGDEAGPLLYATDASNYVSMANTLARDTAFRRKVGEAGQNYYRKYLTDSSRMAERFYNILAGLHWRGAKL